MQTAPLKLVVNGDEYELAGDCTIAGLLNAMEANPDRVAVAVNDDVVPKAEREAFTLNEGDRVEILIFAPGG